MRIIAMLSAVLVSALVLPARASLLVRYTFDEASSGTTNALNVGGSLGASADGVFHGASTRSNNTPNGNSLGSLNLNPNGAAPLEGVGPSTDLNGLDTLSTMTISTWVSVQSQRVISGGDNSYRTLASDFGTNQGWTLFYDTVAGDDRQIQLGFQVNHGPGTFRLSPTTLDDTDSHWIFLAITWDQTSGNVNFYSGTTGSAVTLMGTGTGLTLAMLDNSVAMTLGTDGADSTPRALEDDFRVYDNTLSLAELDSVRLESVPEPASFVLLISGGMLAGRRRNVARR